MSSAGGYSAHCPVLGRSSLMAVVFNEADARYCKSRCTDLLVRTHRASRSQNTPPSSLVYTSVSNSFANCLCWFSADVAQSRRESRIALSRPLNPRACLSADRHHGKVSILNTAQRIHRVSLASPPEADPPLAEVGQTGVSAKGNPRPSRGARSV